MKYFNSINIKEGILWCLFFLLTFFVGYYHGSSPEAQLSYHYSETKNVEILTYSESVLTPEFINYLEKENHCSIKIITKNNFDDFRTELIINRNLYLLLIPENFVDPLFKDNRIKNLDAISSDIENKVHFDLLPKKHDGKNYSLPIAWYINVFSTTKDKLDLNSSIFLLKNNFLDKIKILNPKWNISNLKNKVIYHGLTDKLPTSYDFLETTIQQAENKKIIYKTDPVWSRLIIYSFAIPNVTPDKDFSLRLVKNLLQENVAKNLLQRMDIGYTWKNFNSSNSLFNSPESLRNLNFNNFNPNYTEFDEKFWKN